MAYTLTEALRINGAGKHLYTVTMVCITQEGKRSEHDYEVEANNRNQAAAIMRRKFPKSAWSVASVNMIG